MVVRNISGIGGAKPIPVIHFIPPEFNPIWKVEVITDNETIDVTEILVEGNYVGGVTSTIGEFNIKIIDPENTNSNKIDEFDTVKFYIDYGTTAETLRFIGRIERKSNQEEIYLVLSGRDNSMITTGINVTYSSIGYRSVILKSLIEKYFSETITTDGVEDDLTEIEVSWEGVPFWSVVEELCISGGRDAYIDVTSDFQYFLKGSRTNNTEAIVEDINLIETSDYAKDTQEIYTKVRVYGKKIGNIPIIATSKSDTTYTKGISKELKIENANVATTNQAIELANAESSDKKIPPTIGMMTSLMLPTLLPGEKVKISNPINNIPPDFYEISSFNQIFSEDVPKTNLTIKKQRLELSKVLKSNIKSISQVSDNVNKNDMDFSNIIGFETDSGVHTNTVINEGYLKVKDGESTGSWTSDVITLDSDVSAIEFRMTGDYLVKQYGATTSYIWFSLDGGTTWQVYTADTTEVPTGTDLKIRIDLNSEDATVQAVAVLYKL